MMLTIPQADLTPEQQQEFTSALETGKPVWYNNYCWIVMEHYGPEGKQVNFMLTKVRDHKCFP